MDQSPTGARWKVVAVVVASLLVAAWLMLRRAEPAPTEAATAFEREVDRLRRAQALAVNDPTEANVIAWERAARAYRVSRWSQP